MEGLFDGRRLKANPSGNVSDAPSAVEHHALRCRSEVMPRCKAWIVKQEGLAADQYGSLFGAPAVVESVLPLGAQPVGSN